MDPTEPVEPCTPEEEAMIRKNFCNCKTCEIEIAIIKIPGSAVKPAIHCRWCDGWEEDDSSEGSDEETSDCCNATKERKKTSFYCRSCTRRCWHCETRGCIECVDVVCCDCCVSMCKDCANTDILCGCYGECYSCGRDVNRGADGWPCNDCDKWYCSGCRYGDNECEECNPHDEETSEGSEEDEEETPYINIEEKVEEIIEENAIMNTETSFGSDSCEATLDNDVAEPSSEPSSEPSTEPSSEPSQDSTILLFA